MTDPMDDLRQASAEVSGVEVLSPAAQAVLDAVTEICPAPADEIAAVALRAAADQVVPEYETTPGGSKIWPSEPVLSIRAALLAIAAELEGASG